MWTPLFLSYLAWANGKIGRLDEAWTNIREAMTAVETTKERWCEAEINRIAGEITLMSPEPEAAKAQAYFERALSVARQQQAKSWELSAAISLARLWRDQGKFRQARELNWVMAGARAQPVVLALEDLHWALINALSASCRSAILCARSRNMDRRR